MLSLISRPILVRTTAIDPTLLLVILLKVFLRSLFLFNLAFLLEMISWYAVRPLVLFFGSFLYFFFMVYFAGSALVRLFTVGVQKSCPSGPVTTRGLCQFSGRLSFFHIF